MRSDRMHGNKPNPASIPVRWLGNSGETTMTNFSKLALGATGMAALFAVASPASAQYQGQPYQNDGGSVLGAIINGVTGGGYGQYPQGNYGYGGINQRVAVNQCARAVEQGRNGYARNGYGQNGYANNGYANNGYGNGNLRVVGITQVERKRGVLKVSGIASTGFDQRASRDRRDRDDDRYERNDDRYDRDGRGEYGNNGYYRGNMQANVRFSCRVDLRGNVQDVRIDRGVASTYRR